MSAARPGPAWLALRRRRPPRALKGGGLDALIVIMMEQTTESVLSTFPMPNLAFYPPPFSSGLGEVATRPAPEWHV
jgi:hypothetical protein